MIRSGMPTRRQVVRTALAGAGVAGLPTLLSLGPQPAAADDVAQGAGQPAGLGDAAAERIRARARAMVQLHALVVARDGVEVLGEVVRGPDLDRPVNVKSVSKTVVAALTGIAIDRGVLEGPDQTLVSVLPEARRWNADPRIAAITVDHLLTMRAGLERTSGANYGGWVASGDWVRDALSRPFVAEPGGRFLYSTGSYHLMGAVLAEAADRSLLDLARDWLGGPLGLAVPPWTQDPQGRYMGGNNMAISPRGLVRFGEAFRQGGRYGDRAVVSDAWIRASWTARTRSPWSGDQYGYGWFLTRLGGLPAAYGRGYGGQFVVVVPEPRLTIAVTSDPGRPARSGGYFDAVMDLLTDIVVAARAV